MVKSIKGQLALAFGALMLLSLLAVSWGWMLDMQTERLNNIEDSYEEIKRLQSSIVQAEERMLLVDRTNPDFMTKGTSVRVELRDSLMQTLDHRINHLLTLPGIHAMGLVDNLASLKQRIDHEENLFQLLKDTVIHRGFKNFGAVGQLRESIHLVENNQLTYDHALLLMLRRHEKDFFLRKDLKYLKKFNLAIEDFLMNLSQRNYKGNEQEEYALIKSQVSAYQRHFARIVELDQRIGFDFSSGLIGALGASHLEIHAHLTDQYEVLSAQIQYQLNFSETVNFWVLIAILVCGLALTIFFTRRIAKVMLGFKTRIEVLANGNFPPPFAAIGHDEVAETRKVFDNFLQRLKTAAAFSDKIGSGALNTTYDDQFADDVLAKSLIGMREKLRDNAAKEERIRWKNTGLRQLTSTIVAETDHTKMVQRSLKLLNNYIGGYTATLYLLDPLEGNLVQSATQALVLNPQNRLEVGEGLPGQVFKNGRSWLLDQLPDDYLLIKSGLGVARPEAILGVPIQTADQKIGVMEFAKLTKFDPHIIEFLEEAAQQIAISLITKSKREISTRV